MDLNENKDPTSEIDRGNEELGGFDFVLNDDAAGVESSQQHHHEHHKHHESGEHHGSEKKTKGKKTKSSTKKKSPVKKLFGNLSDEIKAAKSRKQKSPVDILKNKYGKLTPSQKKSVIAVSCAVLAVVALCIAFLIVKTAHTHSFGEWVVVSDATCAKPGEQVRKCWCGEEQSSFIKVEHDYGHPEFDTDDGNMVYTCSVCGTEKREIPAYSDLGLPVMELKGDLAGVSKGKYTSVEVSYSSQKTSFESSGQVKLQGSTSIGFEKTNYTVKLKKDDGKKYKVEMEDGWGSHSKYCLKANYCDASQLRNIVSAKLYGQVSRTGSRTDSFRDLVNGGAIDGFPIALYVNGEFHGLYSLNIPKDEWLFDIKDGEGQQAVLFCDTWSSAAYLEEGLGYDVESYGYEYTYCSTEDTQWATDSFNNMIYFLQNNDGEDFVSGIGKYICVDVAIDTMITLYLESAADNMGKNILWVTYDGVKWAPIVYDLDMTWGLTNYGKDFTDADMVCPGNRTRKNLVFSKLYKYMYEDVKSRYDELRKTVFTVENVEKTFKEYEQKIPVSVLKLERSKWIKVPNPSFNNISQITSFADEHFAFVDTYMK